MPSDSCGARAAAVPGELAQVRAERLRARIALARAFDDREALNRALDAARRLLRLDPKLGREALLEVFLAGRYTENREVCIAVGQVFEAPPGRDERRRDPSPASAARSC